MKKKIVILGGGKNQMPLIHAAKKLGYYVVLCDFRNNVEGIKFSDIHYQVNTLSYKEIEEVCLIERPNGIISNSEPAMPIVAKISQRFNLVGNSEKSIYNLMCKNQFRALQKSIGCFAPSYYEFDNLNQIWDVIGKLSYPIIIKPSQCSGSRGSKRIDDFNYVDIENACKDCFHYSADGKIIIEDFIEMPTLTTIEGDIFIHKGKILFDGMFSTTRASWAPMVPMTYTAPLYLDKNKKEKLISTLTKIVYKSGLSHGEYNIEGYFTSTSDCFIIEINVRQGGHEIPMLIKDFTGIDYTKLLVSTCVGDDSYWNEVNNTLHPNRYIIKQTTFSQFDGVYDGLSIDQEIEDYIYRKIEFLKKGDTVERCIDGTSLVAIVDLEFKNQESERAVYNRMNELIKVKLLE